MKKTEKTAVTAAIFAAAMHMGTANSEPVDSCAAFSGSTSTTTVSGVESQPKGDVVIGDEIIETLNKSMAPVYGPPPSDEDKEEVTTATTTVTHPETMVQVVYGPPSFFSTANDDYAPPVTTTVTYLQPVYGTAPYFKPTTTTAPVTTDDYVLAELESGFGAVYGPAPAKGDINYDDSVDVYDLIMLRERFASGNTDYHFDYDVNYDMKVSVADLVILSNHILGKTPDVLNPEKERNPITTMEEFHGVYGPPPTKTTVADDDIITTEPLPQPEYGPPPTDY